MKLFSRTMGEGQPLLILHGLFGSADNWQSLAKTFSEHYKVYLIDQRNHGHSPHDPDISYDLMSEDLLGFIMEEDLRDILLIGHSMGAKTVMRLAQQYGLLIEKMIVADMGLKEYPPHHEQIFKGLFAVDVDNCPSRKEAEERLSAFVDVEGTTHFLLKNLYWKEPGKLAWRFNLEALSEKRTELMKALPPDKIEVPVLFLRGGKSTYIGDGDIENIKAQVPQSTFRTIEDAGHWLHADAPAEFAQEVLAYFGA